MSAAYPTQDAIVAEAHDVLADLTCRWPQDEPPRAIVVFCHGLGSCGREYATLSHHWARNGYLVIHPTFSDAIASVATAEPALGLDPQADLSRWTAIPHVRARMHEILHDPDRWMHRLAVVGGVMDSLPTILPATAGAPAAPLPVAIAGHSFGAFTTQLLAGAAIDLPDGTTRQFRDTRFAAAILLSAQGRDQQGLRDGSWDAMTGPVLTVTGTLDRGAKGGDWRWKSEPFDLAPPGDKVLAVLKDGDHFLGGFAGRDGMGQFVPAQQEAVKAITTAFLDANLGHSGPARDWMSDIDGRVGDCPLTFRCK